MKTRSLRPYFFFKPAWGRLSHAAFRLILALYCMADKGGRVECDIDYLSRAAFLWWPDEDIPALLSELFEKELIVVYPADDRWWIWIPAYSEIHNVHKNEKPSKSPRHPLDIENEQEPARLPKGCVRHQDLARVIESFAADSARNTRTNSKRLKNLAGVKGRTKTLKAIEITTSPGHPEIYGAPETPGFASALNTYVSASSESPPAKIAKDVESGPNTQTSGEPIDIERTQRSARALTQISKILDGPVIPDGIITDPYPTSPN